MEMIPLTFGHTVKQKTPTKQRKQKMHHGPLPMKVKVSEY